MMVLRESCGVAGRGIHEQCDMKGNKHEETGVFSQHLNDVLLSHCHQDGLSITFIARSYKPLHLWRGK